MTKRSAERERFRIFLRLFATLICLLAAALSIISDSALAYLKTESPGFENVFVPVIVSAEFEESFIKGKTKTKVYVRNTGNTSIYVRLMLLPYWVDNTTGSPVGKSAWTPAFEPNENWFQASDGCYYYSPPLEALTDTSMLYNGSIVLLNSTGDGTHQVLEILAQIIQCGPAVNTAWPAVTVDRDGNLIRVEDSDSNGGGAQQ